MATFKQTFEPKLIYVYRISDTSHEGILKIGEASCKDEGLNYFSLLPNSKPLNEAAKDRIRHQTQTAGVQFELLHTEVTAYMNGKNLCVFQDHEVHDILYRSGIKRKIFDSAHSANEWFYSDLETIKKAITAAKEGRRSLSASEVTKNINPIQFRPEQREAIDRAIKQFRKKNGSHQMLWNAKMRFGKTLSALQVIKECDLRRTLILTHRPIVDKGWFEDYEKIFYDRSEYLYGSKNKGSTLAEFESTTVETETGSYIYFASIQDMRGSELVGGKFEKNEKIFEIEWDLIIIDEAHEGTQTDLGKKVLSECIKPETRVLHLSGTPFNLLNSFSEDEIYTWDYVMEQRAKSEWDILHQGDPNPYSCLPKMNIFTYGLGELFKEYADADIVFNFKEFFRVDEKGYFIHEKNVNQFLDLLSKEDPKSNYPYSSKEYRDNFRHSLWMIPGVKEAKALSRLLQKHPVFNSFVIVNVAGDGDEEVDSTDALTAVEKEITKHPENTYTITLSCGRLTTGVSVKAWTACFMLAGSYNTAASAYMQTIFRVQTPAIIDGKQKEECFVFDFAPDRTLKVIAEAAKISGKAGKTTGEDREILDNFLNFCPIIGFDGSKMIAYDTSKMLEQLKRVYIERVVQNGFEDGYLYNDELMKLSVVELNQFDELKKIIGTTKSMVTTGDIAINSLGFTEEEFEQVQQEKCLKNKANLTPEQKALVEKQVEAKKNRDVAISILRGISIRMPLLIYGAELNKELAGHEEMLSLDNFVNLVDNQSWDEFMPKGVTKEKFKDFKKYYDSDVFRAAGRRIRELIQAADNLSIEERFERITTIFNTFRNPDKETVLTPWRVVNMHLTESIGGWRFYDDKYQYPIEVPVFVEQNDISQSIYNRNSKILEINSKSGLYALYCAYSVYKKRAKLELGPKPSRKMEAELWMKVLNENIFVICKTPMAKSITKRTLAGFTDAKVNAHYFEDLVNQLTSKPENFVDKVTKPQYWKKEGDKMKFDAVVGNPPYQMTANGDANGSDPIYHLFIDAACKIGSKVTLIHPGRFLFNAGKTPKAWNEKMLNDEHFKVVRYWADSSEVFPTVDIKGGVAITYWDKDQKFDKIGMFTAYPELKLIVKKVVTKGFNTFADLVYPRDLYRLTDVLYQESPWAEDRQSKGHRYDVGTTVFQVFPELLTDEKPTKGDYVRIFGREENERITKWIKRAYIKAPDNFDFYKIFITTANGSGTLGEVLSTPVVGDPAVGHTVTFLSIGRFNKKQEADAATKYLKTKFTRCMLGVLKVTQHTTRDTWQYVPLQDFSVESDIDWSVSVADIDKQLYKKYRLSQDEIEFIETKVTPME